jgi:hypothetical protein
LASNEKGPGIVSLIVSLGLLMFHIFKYVRDQKQYILGEYWIKSIFVPVCLDPFRNFVVDQSESLRKLHSDIGTNGGVASLRARTFNDHLAKFKEQKDSMRSRFLILKAINNDTYNKVISIIDEMDDPITNYCSYSSLNENNFDVNKNASLYYTATHSIYFALQKTISEVIHNNSGFIAGPTAIKA